MRPPQNAGEDTALEAAGYAIFCASMRPPQNAGEDTALEAAGYAIFCASMRPPQNAGEDARQAGPRLCRSTVLQ